MKLRNLIFAAASVCLMACSADVKTSSKPKGGGGGGDKNTVTGLSVDGTFRSACIAHPLGGMRIITLEGTGKDVVMNTTDYKGSVCEEAYDSEDLVGSFEKIRDTENGTLVKFKIPVSDIGFTWRFLNIKTAEEVTMISESFFEEDESEQNEASIELIKVEE